MKKILFGFLVLTLVFASSCKKSSSTSNSWTFEGNTYTTTYVTFPSSGVMSATCVSSNAVINGGSFTINFFNGATPTGADTSYTIVATPASASQASITLKSGLGAGGSTYSSRPSGSTILTVNVASNGYVTASGSGIMMSNGSDSSTVSFSITQTQ